jgi:ppGpp synthetase/RelA/SpoT-type nucleotidyltranferase
MPRPGLTKSESVQIEGLVREYRAQLEKIGISRDQLLKALTDSTELAPHVHSFRSRLKDPDHLREKLIKKLLDQKKKGKTLSITPTNLLRRVTDLAGIRILHLYTRQIQDINRILLTILSEYRYSIREGPFARTWDDESRAFFQGCGIKTQKSPTLYTSVHYVVESASRTLVTFEIQVRTLMEEVWGEVDHSMNYPTPSKVLACREQVKVLARVTSGATRLVDSIFLTLDDARRPQQATPAKSRRSTVTDKGRG